MIHMTPKIVWMSHGYVMSDDRFRAQARAIYNNQRASQYRNYVIAAPRDCRMWKREAPSGSSMVNVD
eukprot:10622317-Karenia_brevis.AAC.1